MVAGWVVLAVGGLVGSDSAMVAVEVVAAAAAVVVVAAVEVEAAMLEVG